MGEGFLSLTSIQMFERIFPFVRFYSNRLWNPNTKKLTSSLKGHGGTVQSLAFSPDNQLLASGSADDTVRLWDLSSGREQKTLRGHRSGISAVAFSSDNRILASAGIDDAVRL